jgi:GNAT superfamily N-acetyltransferase
MSIIRPAAQQDIESINRVIAASKAYWQYSDDYLREAIPLIQISDEWINRHKGWVIENDSIEGFMGVIAESDGWLLEHLWIHPNAIRSGLGRKALDFLFQIARNNGVQRMRLLPDPPAEEFYRKHGAIYSGLVVSSRSSTVRHLKRWSLISD